MQESEVIIINGIPEDKYNKAVDKAFTYAVQSVAFTKNKLGRTVPERIAFITSGKILEEIINIFLYENGIVINSEICKTSYEYLDHNDFLYDGVEYDTKCYKLNNQTGDILMEREYTSLPAAIIEDQSKNTIYTPHAQSSAFIFAWQKRINNSSVFEVIIPDDVMYQIERLTNKYYGKHKEISGKDRIQINALPGRCSIKQNYYYYHIITAYANLKHDFHKFRLHNTFQNGPLRFGRNFTIKLNNYICPINELNSFASLFPNHLTRNGMKYGVFKDEDYSNILQPPVIVENKSHPILPESIGMHQPTFF